ncbi:recombinase family protein [Sphingomonas colocasiae]|uniref:Recombinase family protein n=1 Tax=Sphingomonas colocasiae TaxID=1848973 RepID=A0ABS7PW63_9SPHN|nr:recombinase family protein [Sphingomonas colocasiae]MBY8825516.1 recombinase family protein [Sphingomonas colocasiae]
MKQRCAIYTRKSSEEGLEQDFNSLHAQREACAAYVMSQASEGWSLVDDIYDDGGISGGTLDRPALQRLLADIQAGRIDIVVVYKVDRLTRSLLDFAKLVEAFDRAGTSFVSVTQSFNTTTSMGRLTLNMLLSFAQFEREVTAERIRDKIAASKARGMWMGGTPPLGYQPDGRTLAIVEDHAALVRDIYRRYLEIGNVRLVAEALDRETILSPIRARKSGATFGGCRFTRGQIYAILSNPIYIGEIRHRGKSHTGQHPPLIERDLWDAVQAKLADNVRGKRRIRQASPSILAGRIVDEAGDPLVAAHARKNNVSYRYYVSRALQHGGQTARISNHGLRIPAREIEALVVNEVKSLFADPLNLMARLKVDIAPHRIGVMQEACAQVTQALSGKVRAGLAELLMQVRVLPSRVEIDVDPVAIANRLGIEADPATPMIMLGTSVRLTRTGRVVQLVQDNGVAASAAPTDEKLLRLIGRARRWWRVLRQGDMTIDVLAVREGVTASYMTRVVRLAFLSPAVVEAIMAGTAKAGVDGASLTAPAGVPVDWDGQAKLYLAGRA